MLSREVAGIPRRVRRLLGQEEEVLVVPRSIDRLTPLRDTLMNHAMYSALQSMAALHIFMERHVFAVWDFMSLLKRLQTELTTVRVPWTPPGNDRYARLINEIVLGEESDEDGQGGYTSHFGLYLSAMAEAGANLKPILSFTERLETGENPWTALQQPAIPSGVREFVSHTLSIAETAPIHSVAAAFFYGREDIIPGMFQAMIARWTRSGEPVTRFHYYLARHIEVDRDRHGPWAQELLADLCGSSAERWDDALTTAEAVLSARVALWNSVLTGIAGP